MRRGRFEAKALEDAMRRAVERALREAEATKTRQEKATAGGDRQQLRGIPVVGAGVDGAVRGTRPGDGLR